MSDCLCVWLSAVGGADSESMYNTASSALKGLTSSDVGPECVQCGGSVWTTTHWRRDAAGHYLCSTCIGSTCIGLYQQHKVHDDIAYRLLHTRPTPLTNTTPAKQLLNLQPAVSISALYVNSACRETRIRLKQSFHPTQRTQRNERS